MRGGRDAVLLRKTAAFGFFLSGEPLKIVRVETLQNCGEFAFSKDWRLTRKTLHKAIERVSWPEGSKRFTIHPERRGNGVRPIKRELMLELKQRGWKLEKPLDLGLLKGPGKLDAILSTQYGCIALEWETGNISSSHRSLNKMALGLLKGALACGILVVPSRRLYQYLTDRIGNITELNPYLDLWRAIPCQRGVLEIVVVEHDAESKRAPKIPKGTDGRALR